MVRETSIVVPSFLSLTVSKCSTRVPDLIRGECFLTLAAAREEVLSGVAKHSLSALVPTGDNAVQALAYNRIGGGIDNGCEQIYSLVGLQAVFDLDLQRRFVRKRFSGHEPFCATNCYGHRRTFT